jgi:fructose-1,6-bisphosphatase/inositol monophosphatase family enzyme
VTPDALLALFDDAATAAREAVAGIQHAARRDRTDRPGQYALDLVADEAALRVLHQAPVRVVSEESGVTGRLDAPITVVIDPIDGSTNCARGIAYWCTSLCALDREGPLAALVHNHPAHSRATAMRGAGASRDGVTLAASTQTRLDASVISLGGYPKQMLRSKQSRTLGSIALGLVDVAAGGLDGHIDHGRFMAPWDYLGGLLICREAGGIVRDVDGEEMVTDDVHARRQIVAAGTEELARALEEAVHA